MPSTKVASTVPGIAWGNGHWLAIVRELVELHGGTVGVTSPGKDRGATFLVRLPIRILHQELDGAGADLAAPAPARTINAPELKDLKVLVVEDHVETLNLVQVILEMQGRPCIDRQFGRPGINHCCLPRSRIF